MSNVNDEIIHLQRELEDLKISTGKKIASLKSTINRLRVGEDPRPLFATHHTHSTATPAGTHRDRDGNVIYIGCVVRFLTKGRFESTEGVVAEYNKSRVVADDYQGRPIERAQRDVRVICRAQVINITDIRQSR